MTYAGSFGLPKSGGLIIVRPGNEPLRVTGYAFDRRRDEAPDEESTLRGLLREVVAIRKAGKKK